MESRGDTVRNAIRHEDTFVLEDLPDFEHWLANGGSLDEKK